MRSALAIAQADVHYTVVKDFIERIRKRAVGVEVSSALNPAQQVVKIVNEELIATLGEPKRLDLMAKNLGSSYGRSARSGKNYCCCQITEKPENPGRKSDLVAADPYRPAAVNQLQSLGEKIDVAVFAHRVSVLRRFGKEAYDQAKKGGYSVGDRDSAGRSQMTAR